MSETQQTSLRQLFCATRRRFTWNEPRQANANGGSGVFFFRKLLRKLLQLSFLVLIGFYGTYCSTSKSKAPKLCHGDEQQDPDNGCFLLPPGGLNAAVSFLENTYTVSWNNSINGTERYDVSYEIQEADGKIGENWHPLTPALSESDLSQSESDLSYSLPTDQIGSRLGKHYRYRMRACAKSKEDGNTECGDYSSSFLVFVGLPQPTITPTDSNIELSWENVPSTLQYGVQECYRLAGSEVWDETDCQSLMNVVSPATSTIIIPAKGPGREYRGCERTPFMDENCRKTT